MSSTSHDHIHDSTVEEVHDRNTHQFEGEHGQNNVDVEGKHQNPYPLVEGELNGSILNVSIDQTDNFHDVSYNVSNVGKGFETDVILEDVPLDFDHVFLPIDRWARSHPT